MTIPYVAIADTMLKRNVRQICSIRRANNPPVSAVDRFSWRLLAAPLSTLVDKMQCLTCLRMQANASSHSHYYSVERCGFTLTTSASAHALLLFLVCSISHSVQWSPLIILE